MIEPKTSVLILPKDIKPEEVIRLADSLPVENVTIIVGSTPIVQNQAIDELKQEQVAQEVLDAADDFKSSINLKNTIENVHDESSDDPVLIVPIVSESTQSVPTSLAALLPESNLIPVATNDSLVQAPAVVAEDKTEVLGPACTWKWHLEMKKWHLETKNEKMALRHATSKFSLGNGTWK